MPDHSPTASSINQHTSLLPPSPSPPHHAPPPPHPLLPRASKFMLFHFLLAFSEMILVAPLLSLFEHSLCLSYYQHDPSTPLSRFLTPSPDCKIPAIQRDLATIRGWKSSLDTLPVFLVAVPMGKLADRYGRRRLMAVNLLGVLGGLGWTMVVCARPGEVSLRWVWGSSAVLLCGGGLYTSAALMWAMVAEGFEEGERSKAMYYIFSAFYIAELVASGIASVTMEVSPWIGCWLAVLAILCALALLGAMPRSLSAEQARVGEGRQASRAGVATFKEALANRNVLFAMPVFLVGALRYTVLNVLMQYASVRFGWPISRTALIYTETAVVTIILFLILVPQTTSLLRTKYGFQAPVLDLGMVRASVTMLCLGALCIAISGNSISVFISVLIFAFGFGSRVSMLSLISHWTSDSSKGGFYAAIAVLENIGHAVGDPSLHNIFATVIGRTDALQSLPFFAASALYCVATISAFSMRVETDSGRSHEA